MIIAWILMLSLTIFLFMIIAGLILASLGYDIGDALSDYGLLGLLILISISGVALLIFLLIILGR